MTVGACSRGSSARVTYASFPVPQPPSRQRASSTSILKFRWTSGCARSCPADPRLHEVGRGACKVSAAESYGERRLVRSVGDLTAARHEESAQLTTGMGAQLRIKADELKLRVGLLAMTDANRWVCMFGSRRSTRRTLRSVHVDHDTRAHTHTHTLHTHAPVFRYQL